MDKNKSKLVTLVMDISSYMKKKVPKEMYQNAPPPMNKLPPKGPVPLPFSGVNLASNYSAIYNKLPPEEQLRFEEAKK
jgi:hypothetical protein